MARRLQPGDIERLRTLSSTDHTAGVLEAELRGYAAEAAVKELLENWADAQKSATSFAEFNTTHVLDDIVQTIIQLQKYAAAAEASFR